MAYSLPHRSPLWRVLVPLGVVLAILAAGTAGYYLLGNGRFTWDECAYMTAITVSTVGFREAIDVSGDPFLRFYTVVLIFVGAGSIVYLMSNVTAFLVEGEFNQLLRRRRMDRLIAGMEGHYIVCGLGRNGDRAAERVAAAGLPLVLVDRSEDAIQAFLEAHGLRLPYVVGDARDGHVLARCGIARARGLFASLTEDQDNIYLVLEARELNPGLRVVSKVNDQHARKKFVQVGADAVVSPAEIGGLRMFSEMVRPGVTSFLDDLLHRTGENLVMDEVAIVEGSVLHGRRLADSGIRQRTNLLVVGTRDAAGGAFHYNPGPDQPLAAGMTLIVLGPGDAIASLREMAGAA